MGKYFGTDGFRGKAGKVLTAEHAFKIGKFLGYYYRANHKGGPARIVIGKDTRRSSYMYENALASGITSTGSDAYLLHVTTTPCVSYITRTEGFDCGVMISASHNPYFDNGIKLMNFEGEKMDDEMHAQLERYIDGLEVEIPVFVPITTDNSTNTSYASSKNENNSATSADNTATNNSAAAADNIANNNSATSADSTEKNDSVTIQTFITLPDAQGDEIGRTIDFYSGRNRYIGYLTGIPTHSFEKNKVALDCANGASWMIAPAVFNALGAKTNVINAEPDGLNVNLNCGSTHLESLKKYVKENHMDIGFAFDGDADRCLAVDENGNELNGDKIMYICAKWMKKTGMLPSNTVVTTIMSNFGLYKALDAVGIDYEKTAVGDRYVYENMKEFDHIIGGEQSGHVIFRKYAHTGDGLITALMLMSVMIETKLPISALAAGCEMYPQVLKNVEVDDKDETLNDAAVVAAVNQATADLGDNGRVLLRKSGTEPVLRVMSEAGTLEECEKQVDAIIDAMKVSGHLLKIR